MAGFWRKPLFAVVVAGLLIASGDCKRRSRGKDDDLQSGNELSSNIFQEDEDLSSEESLMKGRGNWDPSFLDVLSSDYFDDKVTTKPVKFAEDDDVIPVETEDEDPMGVPVAPGVEEEEVVTARAPCLGCSRDVDPEDEKIRDVASFAFKTHLNSLEDSELGRHFVRVVKAQTQVVAGQKYTLDLELGFSNCSKSELSQEEASCLIDPEKETFICTFDVVEQSWRNHTELLMSKCDQPVAENTNRAQEEADEAHRDPEEAEARLDDLDSDEVEAILEQVTTTTPKQENKRRRRRDMKAVGGLHDAEEDRETLLDLAKYAVEQLDVIDEDSDARLVVDIVNAQKQTVSGWLYHLKIRVAQTTCPEGEEVTYEKCKDKIILPYNLCDVKILFQPWQTIQKKVTESQCSPEKMKKGKKLGKQLNYKVKGNHPNDVVDSKALLGGFSNVNPDSEDLQALTEFVMAAVDAQSNALHAQKMVRVIEAQRQVVSGVKTKMVIELGYTGCRKQQDLDREKCEVDESREHNFCRVTVWEQPWLKSRKMTESRCGKKDEVYGQAREKRSPAGVSIVTSERGVMARNVVISEREQGLDMEEKRFGTWMAQHGKKYDSKEEYQYRLGIFKQSLRKIKLLQEYEEGTATYGVTRFADLTEEEFSAGALGLRPELRRKHKHAVKQAKIPRLPKLPEEFDWRNYNAVTPVKNQGLCGSCWAFSVTGNIEGLYAVKHKQLMSFSEQELVDCDTLDEGCNGGLPENAYKVLQKMGGLETETEYPYDGKNEKCHFDENKVKAKVKGFVELPKNETEMAMWLTKNGPISIGINANAMQFYWGGVSKPWKFLCSPKNLDHGVLIVGYGVHTTSVRHKVLPYWIVKNSWGPHWGEQGYYRVYRGANTCGISEMATSATIF